MRSPVDGPGTIINGRYQLVELAGRGTMAEVWRAEQVGAEGFHRPVAVKRMLSRLVSSPQYRAMFIREAQINASLDHPNVVQVLDFGEDAAGLFLVSEWVEGLAMRDINALCQAFGVRASPVLVAAIGIEVLRALEAAHSHTVRQDDGSFRAAPIIHRDLAPSNVLLSVRGVVKLADFGIARTLDDPGLTPAGAMLPKLGYMAPEVASGQQPGVAADLYGVGVLLWESVVGQRLWHGRTDAEVIMALAHGVRPPPLQSVRPDVPASIAAAIERALSSSPSSRFPSAAAFARELSDTLRLIPERTDTTRLATEVANALNLRRQIEARRPRTQPPVRGPQRPQGFAVPAQLPPSNRPPAQQSSTHRPPSVRPPPAPALPRNFMVVIDAEAEDTRTTLELVGQFPAQPPVATQLTPGTAPDGTESPTPFALVHRAPDGSATTHVPAAPTEPSLAAEVPPWSDGSRPSVELQFGLDETVEPGDAEPHG